MVNTIVEIPGHFRWLDCVLPTPEELGDIAAAYELHPTSVQDCLQPEHLPKFEKFDNALFLIARAYDEEAPDDADSVQELTRKIAVFWNHQFFITIHRQDQAYMGKVRDAWRSSASHPASSFHILHDLLKRILLSYEAPLLAANEHLDHFEEKIFLERTETWMLQELYLLKRKATVFKKMIFLSKDILNTLALESRQHRPLLQDLQETADRLFFLADQLLENTTTLLNLHISLSSHRTNEVMRILTLFSVFFMPLTFIVGIYGMNFHFMPELNHPLGYPAVIIVMLFIALAIYIWFRRKGWLG